MQVGFLGRDIIEAFESCERPLGRGLYTTYRDAAGVLTLGYGHTNAAGPPIIKPGVVWTLQQCNEVLNHDLEVVAQEVDSIIAAAGMPPQSEWQFDALCSFHFNTGKLGVSSIPPLLAAGHIIDAMAKLKLYVNAGGKPLKGLVRRREAEQQLYLGNIREALEISDVHAISTERMAKANGVEETA
jgi:lysozyme